ncbi:hypothetical protein MMC29_003009 [Sticta canariensis]|nr:hypothetical protein [Sticta canariensis]
MLSAQAVGTQLSAAFMLQGLNTPFPEAQSVLCSLCAVTSQGCMHAQDKEAASEAEADVPVDAEEEEDEPEEILIEPNEPGEASALAGLWNRAKHWVLQKLGRTGAVSPTIMAATNRQATKDNFLTQQRQLTDLTKEKAELEKKLALDLGHEGEYMSLVDRLKAFNVPVSKHGPRNAEYANVDKYVYSVCPFKDAFQKDGGSSTRLGNWAGWESAGTVMSFTGGQGCWQGPARSIRYAGYLVKIIVTAVRRPLSAGQDHGYSSCMVQVEVSCGQDEVLQDVQEPNRCEYTARMTTPAACTPDSVLAVQQLLAASERDVLEHTEL